MKRQRIVLAVLLASLIHLLSPLILDMANRLLTTKVEIDADQTIHVDLGYLRPSVLLVNEYSQSLEFLVQVTEGQEPALLFEDAELSYRVFVDEVLAAQNIDPAQECHVGNRAYLYLPLGRAERDRAVGIRLETYSHSARLQAERMMLVGSKGALDRMLAIRLMLNTSLFVCFCIMLALSAASYLKFKTDYMLITLLISIITVIKSIISGELYLFLLTGPSPLIGVVEMVTGIISFYLSLMLFYRLFELKLPRRHLLAFTLLFFTLEAAYLLSGWLPSMILVHIIGTLAIILMGARAYGDRQSKSLFLLAIYSIFSATVIYRFLITLDVYQRGYFSSLVYSPQVGTAIYMAGVIISVTGIYAQRLKSLEQKRQVYEKVTLLRGLNHDLKLPLSVIKLNTQMLDTFELTAQQRSEHSAVILHSVDELEQMADQIGAYLEAVSTDTQEHVLSVCERLEELSRRYFEHGALTGISFSQSISEEDTTLPISPLLFDRMISNLLDNAFTYSEVNGEVSLTYSHTDCYRIIISDTGLGMDTDSQNRAFDPFFRADSSRNTPGSGLGLSVVKAAAESFGATVSIASRPSEGTRVTISWL